MVGYVPLHRAGMVTGHMINLPCLCGQSVSAPVLRATLTRHGSRPDHRDFLNRTSVPYPTSGAPASCSRRGSLIRQLACRAAYRAEYREGDGYTPAPRSGTGPQPADCSNRACTVHMRPALVCSCERHAVVGGYTVQTALQACSLMWLETTGHIYMKWHRCDWLWPCVFLVIYFHFLFFILLREH